MFQKFFEVFIWSLKSERRISLNTQKAYEQDLYVFSKFLKNNELDLQKFYMFLKNDCSADATVARRFSTIMQFLKFLNEENLAQYNIQDKPTIKLNKLYGAFMEQDDLDCLRNALTNSHYDIRLAAIIEALYSTGLRISELLHLKILDLPFILKNQYLLVKGKGGYERVVFFSDLALEKLQQYIDIRSRFTSNEFLFGSKKAAITRQRVFQMLKKLAVMANIDPVRIFPHSFRHRLLTDLILGGADLISVQKIAGHRRINTTERYTHIEDYLYDDIAKFHPLS